MNTRHSKMMLFSGVFTLIFSLFACVSTPTSYDNPAEYMNAINKFTLNIQKDMWEYVRTLAHVKDIKKIEAKRQQVISTIEDAINKINKIEPYNDDFVYKNGVLEYLYIQSVIMKEDYAKIMDLEAIAEQSYDAMEAYILAKKVANQKMEDAGKALEEKEQIFAKNNQVMLTKTSSDITEKLQKSGEVMDYYNEIYLIFFKSNKQEWYMMNAVRNEDTSKTEQNRKTLIKYSDEGLEKLGSIKPYNTDDSLLVVCKSILEFYKKDVSEYVPVFMDYLEQKELYEQIKASLDLKEKSEITREDADTYNEKVEAVNEAVKKYNGAMEEMNNQRNTLIDSWNKTAETFIDKHVPN